jgi:hypothetical protein
VKGAGRSTLRSTMYPVQFDVTDQPTTFQRAHVFLRILILVLISFIASPLGILYLGLPVVAAVFVAQKGGERYVQETGPKVATVLRWLMAVTAYIAILTDRLPGGGEEPVRLEIERSGSPTVGSCLLRILYAIPSALALTLVGFVGLVVWVAAAVLVLVRESYPQSFRTFLTALARWQARLFVYLASLVEPYPPFRLGV